MYILMCNYICIYYILYFKMYDLQKSVQIIGVQHVELPKTERTCVTTTLVEEINWQYPRSPPHTSSDH